MIEAPKKPFPEYKWQWATVTCTEGLNFPPAFLGVLRAMRKHEGESPSNPTFNKELKKVESQTALTVRLSRTPERNIIRNSGQYWKALDLMEDDPGRIRLTPFGKRVADRNVTKIEFATTTVKTLELPNLRIEVHPAPWEKSGLLIKPLELILRILAELEKNEGKEQAYVTPFELVKIVIPLAGGKAPIEDYSKAIILHRLGKLDISSWPDCAPSANDQRMAREFLLFLANYGICNAVKYKTRMDERYYLATLAPNEADDLVNVRAGGSSLKALEKVKESQIPFIAERKKVLSEIIARPQQQMFRRNVLIAYKSTCLITGETLPTVLEASHIKPAPLGGSDGIENGFCFRADVHLLFDAGHLQIDPKGEIKLSDSAQHSSSYRELPRNISIPDFVNKKNLEWRWMYY